MAKKKLCPDCSTELENEICPECGWGGDEPVKEVEPSEEETEEEEEEEEEF